MKVILEFACMRSQPIEWPDQTPPVITIALINNNYLAHQTSFISNPNIIKLGHAKFEFTGRYENGSKIYSLVDFRKGD